MDRRASLEAVLFDFDGTLVRLNADFDGLRRELAALLEPYGFRSSFRPLFQCVKEAEAHLRDRHGEAVAGQLMARIWEAFYLTELRAVERAELLPGVPEVWRWLKEHGIPTAMVSNNHSEPIKRIMTRLDLSLPPAIVGRDQVRCLKPDPEGARLALEWLGKGPEGAWMVGDSAHDMEAGLALNLRVALVSSPWLEVMPQLDPRVQRLLRIDALIPIWEAG